MKKEITICDLCDNDLAEIDTYSDNGHGSLEFKWVEGGNGGGSGDTIKYQDLCKICTKTLRKLIMDWEEMRKIKTTDK